jgi:hypothetical protein
MGGRELEKGTGLEGDVYGEHKKNEQKQKSKRGQGWRRWCMVNTHKHTHS